MRSFFIAVVVLIAVSLSIAGSPTAKSSSPEFEKLKSLAGNWQGKDEEGKPFTSSYQIVSAGTAVMETLNMGEDHGTMITMYHQDGNKIMMTHYCSMGNQPRMKASGLSKSGDVLSFKFVDVTNAKPSDSYMMGVDFTFKDADHISQKWTMKMTGEKNHPDTFDLERVK